MSDRKTVDIVNGVSHEMRPQRHGGALSIGGRPGNPGGRLPDTFKRLMRDLVARPEVQDAVDTILHDPKHKHWPKLYKIAVEYAYGKATQHVEHSGLTADERRQRLQDILALASERAS